jgi:hypothetical protein
MQPNDTILHQSPESRPIIIDVSEAATSSPTDPGNALSLNVQAGESSAAAIARTLTRPTVQAAITARELLDRSSKEDPVDLNELILSLGAQAKAVLDGDLSRTEAMLVTQAQTLDLLFNKLTRLALSNIGEYPDARSIYLKLALKAQSQCRAVAATLHEMKHPTPVAVFQQANIANGPQQVNNGQTRASIAEENQNAPNELSNEDKSDG